jgi:hypothetical protein
MIVDLPFSLITYARICHVSGPHWYIGCHLQATPNPLITRCRRGQCLTPCNFRTSSHGSWAVFDLIWIFCGWEYGNKILFASWTFVCFVTFVLHETMQFRYLPNLEARIAKSPSSPPVRSWWWVCIQLVPATETIMNKPLKIVSEWRSLRNSVAN